MTANASLKLSDALKIAVDENLSATNTVFRPQQNVLQYSQAEINKFLPVTQSSLYPYDQVNGIMRIAKDKLFGEVFNNGEFFTAGQPVARWTSHAGILAYVGLTIDKVSDNGVDLPNK